MNMPVLSLASTHFSISRCNNIGHVISKRKQEICLQGNNYISKPCCPVFQMSVERLEISANLLTISLSTYFNIFFFIHPLCPDFFYPLDKNILNICSIIILSTIIHIYAYAIFIHTHIYVYIHTQAHFLYCPCHLIYFFMAPQRQKLLTVLLNVQPQEPET